MAQLTIAIDAMGGDFGPSVTVPAALSSLKHNPTVRLVLVGDRDTLLKQLKDEGAEENDQLKIQHASQEVTMTDLPSQALRYKKDSSMRVAINQVKEGVAKACVSAGNTGALMAIARFVLKTLPGIDRPAIISSFPTVEPGTISRMLDLGANIDSCADHLYQFAVMGSVFAAAIDGIPRPRIGLMNIGVEEIKGNDQVKRTAQLLSENPAINYIGYVEGNDIFSGQVDVIVADGFVGNVSLKTIEGTAKMIGHYIKEAFYKNPYSRILGLCAKSVLNEVHTNIDPDERNGASLLGLRGIVVKSHGGAPSNAFRFAIQEAINSAKQDIPARISREVGVLLEDSD